MRVITQPCPGLVELIEQGEMHNPGLRQLLAGYVEPLLGAGCDTLILGCTHYPFLKPLLHEMVPESVAIIDTGAAVARHLRRLLGDKGMLASGPPAPAQFWTSADTEHFQNILPMLWNKSGDVHKFTL
ncbi:Glutamate racemase [compost metagenome]